MCSRRTSLGCSGRRSRLLPASWIESGRELVSDQREGQDKPEDAKPGRGEIPESPPPGSPGREGLLQHQTPGRDSWIAEAEKAERCLVEDRDCCDQNSVRDHERKHVRKEVNRHD